MGVDSVQHHGEALAEALSEYLEYTIATRIAEKALGPDGRSYQLIGLTGRGTTAVFYQPVMKQVTQRCYDPPGLSDSPGVGAFRQIEKVSAREDVEELLLEDTIAAEWIWVHPRWRWAVESEFCKSG
ncbi:MAG: hypothetical protein ABEH81_04260 [Halopenitus sp.]